MDRNKAIENFKDSLKKLMSFTKQKFNNFKLTDGTQITTSADDIAVGVELYQIDDLGNQTPLDNGDYVLEDGRTFTIKDNKIVEIAEAAMDGTDVETGGDETDAVETSKQKMDSGLPEGHDKANVKDAPEADTQKAGDVSDRVENLEKQVAEILNLLGQMGPAQNEANEQMMTKINKFESNLKLISSEPGDEPIKTQKKGYEVYSKKNIKAKDSDEALERLRKITKEMRDNSNNNYL